MTVVVTGASGHVGTNLVRELRRQGRAVRAVMHPDEPLLERLQVEQVRGDVRDPASLRRAFGGAEVLYHLAAVISIDGDRSGLVRATNVEGVRNVAEAARACGVRRMVHCSSVHAFFQEPLDEPLDETRPQVSASSYPAYDRSKAAGEIELRKVIATGLDAVIVNPTGIIGPYDHGPSRMGRFFLALCARRLAALLDSGFDWVDVRDVVAGAIAAETRGRTGENYLVSGQWHSLRELAALAEQITGVAPPTFTCPMRVGRLVAPVSTLYAHLAGREPLFTAESLHALCGNRTVLHDKAARELGYAPRPTFDTVRDVYDWFAAAGMMPRAVGAPAARIPTRL